MSSWPDMASSINGTERDLNIFAARDISPANSFALLISYTRIFGTVVYGYPFIDCFVDRRKNISR